MAEAVTVLYLGTYQDVDKYTEAIYDEFLLYDVALSARQVREFDYGLR